MDTVELPKLKGMCGDVLLSRSIRGDCVWRFLQTPPDVVNQIIHHVHMVGAWCEWQSSDIRQKLMKQFSLTEEGKIEREMKEMYVWEQEIGVDMKQDPKQIVSVHIDRYFGRVNM